MKKQNQESEPAVSSDSKGATQDEGMRTRLSAVCDLLGTRIEAAAAAGVSTDMLAKYIAGTSRPRFGPLARLAARAGVSLDWLATGEGEKWVSARETPVNSGLDGHQGAGESEASEAEEDGAGCDMMAFARASEVVKRIIAQEELSLTGEATVDLLDLAMRLHDCPSNRDLMTRLARHMARKP